MLWRDLDGLVKESIPQGHSAVFGWFIAARPNAIIELRTFTRGGAGPLEKYLNYVKKHPNFRETCGVSENVRESKVLFVFLGFTKAPKAFRSGWYFKHRREATSKFGSLYTMPELVSTIKDRRFKLQVNLSFDTLEIEHIEIRELQNHLTSAANLSALMWNIHENNRG